MRRRLEKSWVHLYIYKDKEPSGFILDRERDRKRQKLRKIRKVNCVTSARNPARIPR
jgi:hypothetical protein